MSLTLILGDRRSLPRQSLQHLRIAPTSWTCLVEAHPPTINNKTATLKMPSTFSPKVLAPVNLANRLLRIRTQDLISEIWIRVPKLQRAVDRRLPFSLTHSPTVRHLRTLTHLWAVSSRSRLSLRSQNSSRTRCSRRDWLPIPNSNTRCNSKWCSNNSNRCTTKRKWAWPTSITKRCKEAEWATKDSAQPCQGMASSSHRWTRASTWVAVSNSKQVHLTSMRHNSNSKTSRRPRAPHLTCSDTHFLLYKKWMSYINVNDNTNK